MCVAVRHSMKIYLWMLPAQHEDLFLQNTPHLATGAQSRPPLPHHSNEAIPLFNASQYEVYVFLLRW